VNLQLVAIELSIDEQVLATADAYRLHLEAAAQTALAGPTNADARLVVFPELAGHLALYALAGPAAHRATTVAGALAAAALRRPWSVLRGLASTRRLDGRHAVLAALAPDGERWWKQVFAPLARRHHAWVVAGSHLRVALDGGLTNASHLFDPDGRLVATTDKVNLNPGVEDGTGLALSRADPDALPIARTPFGTIATLIGYDAALEPRSPHERFASLPQHLARRGGVTVVANPASNFPEGLAPALPAIGAYGVTARLAGDVLDLHFEGGSEVLERIGPDVRVLGARAVVHARS